MYLFVIVNRFRTFIKYLLDLMCDNGTCLGIFVRTKHKEHLPMSDYNLV